LSTQGIALRDWSVSCGGPHLCCLSAVTPVLLTPVPATPVQAVARLLVSEDSIDAAKTVIRAFFL